MFGAGVINPPLSTPQWLAEGRGAALFLPYDEHGGFYDHLPPPRACVPDDKAPMLRGTCSGTTTACTCTGSATANTCPSSPDCSPGVCQITDVVGEFDRYGIRVPFVLVSPFARNHYVSHRTYDHTSILRFIESRFDLPALTKRDANADPMLRLFNFKAPPFTTPPALPGAPVDSAHELDTQCLSGMNGAP